MTSQFRYRIRLMNLWKMENKEIMKNPDIKIDRTYADCIDVTLECGYRQKFWVDLNDKDAIDRCKKMKELDIEPF